MLCEKIFSQSSELKLHKLSHIGEKSFKCMLCEKEFSQSSHLKRHKLSHTGEKPLKCILCERTFSQSSNLTRTYGSESATGLPNKWINWIK